MVSAAIRIVSDPLVSVECMILSSLAAYLRSYLTVNLISVEQLSYGEFLEGLPSPSCIVSLSLRPYDGNALIEISPSLVFPILEIILGGKGKTADSRKREITEIEQQLLDTLFRIILNDLREAWKSVAIINFKIETIATEPQMVQESLRPPRPSSPLPSKFGWEIPPLARSTSPFRRSISR